MPPDNDVQQEIEQLEQRFAENAQGLVFAHLADAYRRAGEFAKAEGLLLHGLKTHPTYTSAYNVLGRVYLESERYADAHEQFAKVLELDPTNLIALQALGDLAARGGRLEDARSWYERMLQIDPRSKEAQEGMASLEAGGEDVELEEAPESVPVEDEAPPQEPEAAVEPAAVAEETEPPPMPDEGTAEPEEVQAPWDFSELLGEGSSEEAALGEGAELESVPVQGASSEDAAGGASGSGGDVFDLDDLDLGIMDDWTPGFLGGETPPGAETFETESILEGSGEGLDIDLGGGAFEEDDAEEPEEPEVSREEPVVTETMAELYVGQDLYEDALEVYRKLAEDRPEDERLQERITELEGKLAETRPAVESGEEELAELLELTQPVSPEPFAPEPGVVDPEVVETEDAEPAAEVDTVFSIEDLAPSEPVGSEFEFEDEAPVAGMEQLDPFAVSFDVLAVGSTPREPEVEEEVAEAVAVVEEETAEAIAEDFVAEEVTAEEAAEEKTVEGFTDEVDEGAIEVTVEPTDFVAEDEVSIAAFEFDASDAVDDEIAVEAEGEGEEEAVEEVIVEELPAEPVLASAEEPDESPADRWELTVGVAGDDIGSELAGEAFGAEVVIDESSDDDAVAAETPADFEALELVADFAPPEPEPKPVQEVEEPKEFTIEDYLTGLLVYDPEAAVEESPEEAADAGEAPADSDAAGPEDLEQFQDWLRSLKR